MPVCSITQVINPTSTSSVEAGSTMLVKWNHNSTAACSFPPEDWIINYIKLQTSYPVGTWSDVSTVYNGGQDVVAGSTGVTITIPSSTSVFGDYYRLKIEYLPVEF